MEIWCIFCQEILVLLLMLLQRELGKAHTMTWCHFCNAELVLICIMIKINKEIKKKKNNNNRLTKSSLFVAVDWEGSEGN